MNLDRTQFLFEDHGTHSTIRHFRRKHCWMLLQDGKPLRLMEPAEWAEFKKQWPKQCVEDNLSLRLGWVLVPLTNKQRNSS